MKKCSLLLAMLLYSVAMEVSAQSKDTTSRVKVIQKEIARQETWTSKVYFLNKDKIMKIKESVIQKETPLTVEVSWNPELIKKIIFDTIVYKPTPQEIKACKYRFVVKPERTTTYNYKIYYQDDKERSAFRKITVKDKNGVEIEEKEVKSDPPGKK